MKFESFRVPQAIAGLKSNLECNPQESAEGLRCIPKAARYSGINANFIHFSDSACTKPVFFEEKQPCQERTEVVVIQSIGSGDSGNACFQSGIVDVRTVVDAGPTKPDDTTYADFGDGNCFLEPAPSGNRYVVGDTNILNQLPLFDSDDTFLP